MTTLISVCMFRLDVNYFNSLGGSNYDSLKSSDIARLKSVTLLGALYDPRWCCSGGTVRNVARPQVADRGKPNWLRFLVSR